MVASESWKAWALPWKVGVTVAERIVKRVVDRLGRDAEARCGIAVDLQSGPGRAVLLVGGDVLQLRDRPHFLDHYIGPMAQLVQVRVLQRVLILGARLPRAHGNVL